MANDLINLNAEDGRDIITDSAQTGLNIKQSGTGDIFGLVGSSTGDAISLAQSSTGIGLDISVTTGDGLEVGDTSGAYNAVDIVSANYSHPTVGILKITTSCSSAPFLELTGLGCQSYASGAAAWTV